MKWWRKKKNERVYLDWAAATPLLPEAKAAMEPFLTTDFANPSSIHKEGQKARQAIDESRLQVARTVQVKPDFITFTAGGTEANNLSLIGVTRHKHMIEKVVYTDMEVIATKIDHPSVDKTLDYLSELGVLIKFVSVDERGKINVKHLQELITEKTVLVSYTYVNSEIGTIQPLHNINKVVSEAERNYDTKIYKHLDAAQAPLWLPCQFDGIGVDLMTLDATKCCGPKGVGILVRSRRTELASVLFGGGQEEGLRPGTENVAGIVGTAIAFKWAQANWKERSDKTIKVRDEAIKIILHHTKIAELNGAVGEERIANNINISIPGFDTEYAAVWLDNKGFAVSTKSACSGAGGGESMVISEISSDPARATSTLRITLGPDTKLVDLTGLVNELVEFIEIMEKSN